VTPDLDRDGLVLLRGLLPRDHLSFAESNLPARSGTAGVRVYGNAPLADWLDDGPVGLAARAGLGEGTRAVRAILFDKSMETNWVLGWHQDRTIAVREPLETPGFTHWTVKAGASHVEPPFAVFEGMLTARIHLDPVGADNAPLCVALGSHALGRVFEADITAIVEQSGIFECLAEAGDVWLYRTPILHASDRSRSQDQRRVLQVDYSNLELPEGLDWLGVG